MFFFLWGGLLIILDICNLYDVYEQLLNVVFDVFVQVSWASCYGSTGINGK